MEACGVTNNVGNDQNHNEYLWNGMIYPLLKTSIRGVIWYQGENNAGYPGNDYGGHNRDIYDCTFKQMIESWRQRWSVNTDGATDDM